MCRNDYPWQIDQQKHLCSQLLANRFPQSLIISGMSGLGKFILARSLAKALLCMQVSDDAQACAQCANCRLFDSGHHPDFLCIEPEGKAQQIKVDQIRFLNDFAQKTPQRNKKQVVIIHHAEKMNVAASNALLKTLEEPGRDTVIILITDRFQRLLMTIRSRCQHVRLQTPEFKQALSWLCAQGVPQDKAELALCLSHCAPLNALAYINDHKLDHFMLWAQVWSKFCLKKLNFIEMQTALKSVEVTDQLEFAYLFFCELCHYLLSQQSQLTIFPWQEYHVINLAAVYPLIDQLTSLQSQYRIVAGLNLNLQWQNIIINWVKLLGNK